MQWLRDLLADNIDVFVAAMLGIVGIASTHAMAVVSRRHERSLEQDRAAHATVERQRTERRDLYLRLLEAVEELPRILLFLSMQKDGTKLPMDPQDVSGLERRAEEQLASTFRAAGL